MAKVCEITGKRPMAGNNVSHANNKPRRRFVPNLQVKRFWLDAEKRFITLRLSVKAMRIIDKLGIEKALAKIQARGKQLIKKVEK